MPASNWVTTRTERPSTRGTSGSVRFLSPACSRWVARFCSGWVRRLVPRAGLLGSLTAIALVLISFLPLLDVLHYPIVGLVALSIILATLVARVPLPGRVPGALGRLLVAGTLYYLMVWTGHIEPEVPAVSPR